MKIESPNKNLLIESLFIKKINNRWVLCFKSQDRLYSTATNFNNYRTIKSILNQHKENMSPTERLFYLKIGTKYIPRRGAERHGVLSSGIRIVKGFTKVGDFNIE